MSPMRWLVNFLLGAKKPLRKTLVLHRDGTVSMLWDGVWRRVTRPDSLDCVYIGYLTLADRERIKRSKAHRHLLAPNDLPAAARLKMQHNEKQLTRPAKRGISRVCDKTQKIPGIIAF